MPSESFSSTESVPPFDSTLPPEFLDGLDKRGRYLYEGIDRLSQAMTFALAQGAKHAETLEAVRVQTVKTNGRLLRAEGDIKEIKEQVVATQPVVRAYGFARRAVASKWFWAGTAAFIFFGLPYMIVHAPSPGDFLKAVFGL